MDITSQIIGNQLDNANRYCVHWNQLGEIAYACYNTVQIMDCFSMKIHQSFQSPKSSLITKLKWSYINLDDKRNKCLMKLACADESSNLFIWNSYEQKLIHELNDSSLANHKIADLKWLNHDSNKNENLIVLYTRSTSVTLVVWDTIKGTKIFTKTFNEAITSFTLDPHEYGRLALLGTNFIQFSTIENLNNENININSNTTRRFYITNQENAADSIVSNDDGNKKPINLLTSVFKNFMDTTGSQKNLESSLLKMSLKDCIQIEFHPTLKNIILLIYPKEVFLFELNINQTVGFILIDKNHSSIIQLYACSYSDVIYLLHENGSVSIYFRENIQNKLSLFKNLTASENKSTGIEDIFDNLEKSLVYNLFIQSDYIRLSKNSQIFGFSVCPVTQKRFSIILSDGRLLKYDLIQKKDYQKYRSNRTNLHNNVNSNIYLFDFNFENGPKDFKLTLTNMSNVIVDIPFIFKVCPPLTKKNFKYWQPLLAMGTSNGYLYIYNLNKNCLVKKLLLYNHGIQGIEWYSINCVLTWSSHAVNSIQNINDATPSGPGQSNRQQLVKNELFLTDLRTGESRSVREGLNEESSIVSAKLSIHKQYLVIIFKEQPMEIWDMKNFSLIKKISKKSPIIKVLEWYPLHPDARKIESTTKPLDSRKDSVSSSNQQEINTTNIIPATHSENFICVDEHSLLYSFTIESNHIKDGSSSKILPQDGLISNVTSIAIKKDLIIFGDVEGNLVKWDVKSKTSKFLSYKREIKKIKFAPGKENLFLLVHLIDSLEIIDITNMDTFSSFKFNLQTSPKSRVLDCDWCCSDRITCFFSDNTLKIFDINFKQTPNINTSSDYNPFTQMPMILTSNRTKSLSNESNYVIFKNFFYKTIDSISNINDFDLTKFKEQIINSDISLDRLLNENLLNIIEKMIEFKVNDQETIDKSNLNKKIYANILYSLYFNTTQFETSFWSLLLYVLNDYDEMDKDPSNLLFKKHSILFKRELFRLNEYQLFKIYREKQDPRILNKNNLLIKYLLLSNELDYVFNMLMESEFQSENYMNDYLKACLIASLKNQNMASSSQTSIKLVATNLIANGKLSEGLELLCLIGLVHDACRYMQDNDKWNEAAWLAKMRLNDNEYNDVVKRWCDHLCATKRKDMAVLLYISCKKFKKALEILAESNNHIELTYFFMNICLKHNLINDDLQLPSDDSSSTPSVQNSLINKIIENYEKYRETNKL